MDALESPPVFNAAASPQQERLPRRPWVGLLLSLLVPGFGLIRAGRVKRGLAWLLGLSLYGLFAVLLWILPWVPNSVVLVTLGTAVLGQLWMLRDSWRPGRMTARRWLLFVLLAVGLAICPVPKPLLAKTYVIPTSAMEPTLRGKLSGQPDYIMVNHAAYWFSAPQRGDLVVFGTQGIKGIESEARYTGPEVYLKRLVGLPGETIEIRDGHAFANGRMLDETDGIPDIVYTVPTYGNANGKWEIPEGNYFVLGDNSPRSSDSRYWGFVPKANIMGKAARIYWPLSRMSVPR